MKGCKFCEAMEKKVKTNEQWDAEHAGHGGYTWEQAPHPGGTWFWKVCKCGHKHLRIREERVSESHTNKANYLQG